MASVKMDPKALLILKGKEAFRPVNEKRVEEYALVLKRNPDRWPFPNNEHDGIKVMAATKEVKDKKTGEVTIEETGDFVVLSGATRVTAAVETKWGDIPVYVVKPKSGVEILKLGIAANVEHGARFSLPERDRLIIRCVAEGMTQEETADLFQVHKSTVSRTLRGMQSADPEQKAKGGRAKKGKKKGSKGKAFSPADFIQEGVIGLLRFTEAHHEVIVAYSAGNDRALQSMEQLSGALITLVERATLARSNRPADAPVTV